MPKLGNGMILIVIAYAMLAGTILGGTALLGGGLSTQLIEDSIVIVSFILLFIGLHKEDRFKVLEAFYGKSQE